jgi:hypothetical protein
MRRRREEGERRKGEERERERRKYRQWRGSGSPLFLALCKDRKAPQDARSNACGEGRITSLRGWSSGRDMDCGRGQWKGTVAI